MRLPIRSSATAAAVATVLVLGACSSDDDDNDNTTDDASTTAYATADVTNANADGDDIGTASVGKDSFSDDATELTVSFTGLEPGMYGMHIHTVGQCETDSESPDGSDTGDYLSSGGHMDGDDHDHPSHGGDLPALLVKEDGTASLTVSTDRVTKENLLDDDGSALIIHESPDNYGNIPERYAPDGPDEDSLKTGDAGGRQACGVFEA
ncbi:superoxide dismutase family protein, partial [Corynebacterium variabile]